MGEVSLLSGEETMEMMIEEEEEILKMEMEMNKDSSSIKSVIRWEKFLPRMCIRVLLVEADDSTRHIISALLRKCGYKVTAVSDGSKAWQMLKGRSHNIDIVLTEVELPLTSGFSLLTMIADNDSCRNIPVIMMSTNDSIGVVFKCMTKGAADFFIKPVRKNELRNLWQHVWRRHNSLNSDGYSNQSGRSSQQKIGVSSENSIASTPTADSVESAQNNKECSDKESDAFSSCRKPRTEVREHEEFVKFDNDSECMIVEKEHAQREETSTPCEAERNNDEQVRFPREAIDLIGSIDDRRKSYCIVREVACNGTNTCPYTNDTTNKLELSLRRLDPSECTYTRKTDEKRHLNRSNFSAFSPYNNSMVQPLDPKGIDNLNIHLSNKEHTISRIIPQPMTEFSCSQFGAFPTLVPQSSIDSYNSGYGPPFLPISQTQPFWSSSLLDHHKSALSQTKPESNNFKQVHDLHYQNDTNQSNGFESIHSGINGNEVTTPAALGSTEMALLASDRLRGMDSLYCTTQREMALNKFRLKRKDRCFDKKVRYHSRKKLAEQRPRVKGQFVRQSAANLPLTETNY